MERNSFSSSLKDHSINGNNKAIKVISTTTNDNNNNHTWRSGGGSNVNQGGFGDQDNYLAAEFSWPPRSYTCSFCKREFRSAQALGGHMNVHRRDRARLRQSPPITIPIPIPKEPPFLNLNLNPNPNPNFSFSSSSSSSSLVSSPPLISSSLPSLPLPPSAFSACQVKKWRLNGTLIDPLTSSRVGSEYYSSNMVAVGAKSCFGVKDYGCINNNNNNINKFLKENTDDEYVTLDLEIGTMVSDSKEDLDLELRLGYS